MLYKTARKQFRVGVVEESKASNMNIILSSFIWVNKYLIEDVDIHLNSVLLGPGLHKSCPLTDENKKKDWVNFSDDCPFTFKDINYRPLPTTKIVLEETKFRFLFNFLGWTFKWTWNRANHTHLHGNVVSNELCCEIIHTLRKLHVKRAKKSF